MTFRAWLLNLLDRRFTFRPHGEWLRGLRSWDARR